MVNKIKTIEEREEELITKGKEKGYITYEDFFAVGDGKTNDAYAIYYAHECANKLNIPVIANQNTYYISHLPKASGILIKTDVNVFFTERVIPFTIQDRKIKEVLYERGKNVIRTKFKYRFFDSYFK